MRKRPLFLSACVFLMGLAYQRYEMSALWLLLCMVLSVEVFYGMKSKNKKRMAGRCIVLLSAFVLGMTHMAQEESFREAYLSELEDDSSVVIWGEIIKIETTEYGIRMILSDSYICLKEEKIPCNNIMVYASSNHFHVGEIHKFTGQLHKFEGARNQGAFDSETFYQSQKIDFSVQAESNVLLGQKENAVRDFLLLLKEKLADVFEFSMEAKAAGFYSGMILGDKTNLDKQIKDLFELGGISRILAISGLHVSIIGRRFYSWMRKRGIGFSGAGMLAGMVLIAYCCMVGYGMSAVRAVGMMLLFFLGQYLGRSYDMLNSLGAMCLVLLWDNPFLLEYSGFWFSIMALVGVGFVGKILSEHVEQGKTLWKNIGRSLWMSIGITLTTLPVAAYCYYEIPLYSPLVNFIVLPFLTPAFCLALIGGIAGLWIPWLAYVLLFPCSLVLRLYEGICTIVSKLPGASIITGMPTMQMIVVYYVVLFVGILKCQQGKNTDKEKNKAGFDILKVRKQGVAVMICMICFLLIAYPKDKPFEITFLDVGQGDGIYISAGDGTTCFMDGGSTSEDLLGEYTILPFLKSKGVSSIDYWFVSHADTDHISGLLEVLESGYEIGCLVVSEHAPSDENYMTLVSMAENCGMEVLYMDAEDKIVSENVTFTCLYPWDKSVEDRNEASLVLELELSNGKKALFAGDISSETEQLLLEQGVMEDIWLYKASHHGSKYSNSKAFLEVIQPEVSVVSCSENNNYGHPGKEAIDNMESVGSEVLYTMEGGQVTVQLVELPDNIKKNLERWMMQSM